MRHDDFEDDGFSFRERRIMQLDRMAYAASMKNWGPAKLLRRLLIPVWITGTIFLGVVIYIIGYIIISALI